MEKKVHTIDASEKSPGRLASEISILLRGKNRADFMENSIEGDEVIVQNVDEMKLTGRKKEQKIYYRHSGYPGGLKKEPLEKLIKNKPQEVLKRAVYGMLPKNKLRSEQIKRLKFK